MAITTIDLALAGMKPPAYFAKAVTGTMVAGRAINICYLAGVPGAMAAPSSPGISGTALTSYAGQIPIPAASGNTHLARFSGVSSAQGGILMLCDRLWHNNAMTAASRVGVHVGNQVAVDQVHAPQIAARCRACGVAHTVFREPHFLHVFQHARQRHSDAIVAGTHCWRIAAHAHHNVMVQ